MKRTTSILQDLVDEGDEDKPPHIIVIGHLFAFVGNDPLNMVGDTHGVGIPIDGMELDSNINI